MTKDLAPFVSRDVYVYGRRETLREIAALAGVNPQFFPLKPPSNEVGEQGVSVRVPSPVSLLKAKLANVDQINQEGRQDLKYVTVLFRLLPLYLHDVGQSVVDGRREDREFVNILDELLTVITSEHAARILKEHCLLPKSLFSMLENSKLPKVGSFMKHLLPRRLGI